LAERKTVRRIYGLVFLFLGSSLTLLPIILLRTTLVSDRFDVNPFRVYNLFCTFEKLPAFEATEVFDNVTGRQMARFDAILGVGYPLEYYTYDASMEEIVDMGWLHWRGGKFLAFYSKALENGTDYVVDFGTFISAYSYGASSGFNVLKIVEIHEKNSFDEIILVDSVPISIGLGIILVGVCSLVCLPFIEYDVNTEKKKEEEIEANRSS
jgi:hypothetical protein